MIQFDQHIWTRRFLLLGGLVLAGQIILGIIVYILFGLSFARTAFALAALLLIGGIVILDWLRNATARKIVVGAGLFVLIALLFLMALSGLQARIAGRVPGSLLQLYLLPTVFVLALLAFLGRIISRKTVVVVPSSAVFPFEQPPVPAYWFARIAHLVLAGLAAVELLLQMSFGSRLLLLPFTIRLYDGITLNSLTVWLLGLLILVSLLRFKIPVTGADGWMILIFGIVCALFQYTFGVREFAGIAPSLGQAQIVGINLVLSVVPLALAIFAIFSVWGRYFTPLWLTLQLLILQPEMGAPGARGGAAGGSPTSVVGQALLYLLTIIVILFALRLVFYGDYRRRNTIDIIAVVLIALVVAVMMWSVGQSDFQRAQAVLNTPQSANQLALAESLLALAYVIVVVLVLSIVASAVAAFLLRRFPWIERVENVLHFLLILSVTIGALFLLNSVGSQSNYLTTSTLDLQRLGSGLPAFSVRNQYLLDGLFALALLFYIIALARERWDRSFSHNERVLMILSGLVCLLILASTGPRAVLPLISSSMQQIGAAIQPAFTSEGIVALSILIAALISLLWLMRSSTMSERILLLILFGVAALCALIYYFVVSPIFLLIALFLLLPGTLIAARHEYVQTLPVPQPTVPENGETAVHPTP